MKEALFLSLVLFFYFETEGWIAWINIFGLSKFLPHFQEYNEIKINGGYIKYLDYVYKLDKSFYISLISCPVCLSFWLSVILSCFYTSYAFINFFGLVGYYTLKILQKYSN